MTNLLLCNAVELGNDPVDVLNAGPIRFLIEADVAVGW